MKLSEAAILLVDDEPQLLEIFGFWLAAAGCRNLHTAANGEMAIAVLKTVTIDLLVTDVRMPIMDGITLVRQLGEMAETVPSVIFISGFGDIDQREMYGLGVEAFLAKPLLREDLITVMERALAERRSLWLTPMGVAPRQSNIHLAVCSLSETQTLERLKASSKTAAAKAKFVLATVGVVLEAEDLVTGEAIASDYHQFSNPRRILPRRCAQGITTHIV